MTVNAQMRFAMFNFLFTNIDVIFDHVHNRVFVAWLAKDALRAEETSLSYIISDIFPLEK